MAAAPVRRLEHQRLNAVAVVGDELVEPSAELQGRRERARTALARVRARLSQTLLGEIWTQSAGLDVAIWGHAATEVEADRTLREAADRGVLFIDPTPATEEDERGRRGRLRGVLGRLTGDRA